MDCALDSWENRRTEARENYAGALEVILSGAERVETRGEGSVAGDVTGRLEADFTVVDEAGSEGGRASGNGVRSGMAGVGVEGESSGNARGSIAGEVKGVGKRMSVGSLLLKRVRYFTDGAVIGSKAFVERVFESNRGKFSEGRKHASRPWRDPGDLGKRAEFGLHTLKDLRVDVYEE